MLRYWSSSAPRVVRGALQAVEANISSAILALAASQVPFPCGALRLQCGPPRKGGSSKFAGMAFNKAPFAQNFPKSPLRLGAWMSLGVPEVASVLRGLEEKAPGPAGSGEFLAKASPALSTRGDFREVRGAPAGYWEGGRRNLGPLCVTLDNFQETVKKIDQYLETGISDSRGLVGCRQWVSGTTRPPASL